MLEDCLIESRPFTRSRGPFTLAVPVVTHGGLVAVLVLIPLFQRQVLPRTSIFEPLRPPEVHTRVTALAPAANQAAPAPAAPVFTDFFAPIAIPNKIAHVVDVPIPGPAGFPSQGIGGGGNSPNLGLLLGPPDSRQPAPPPPPPAPPPVPPKSPDLVATAPATPVPRGGDVVMSNLVHQVQPVYPVLARKTHTQGVVLLEAVITREGTIDPARIRVISGNVLLNDAAVDAVKQWRYRPTLLNKVPVEIVTTIAVNFTFN